MSPEVENAVTLNGPVNSFFRVFITCYGKYFFNDIFLRRTCIILKMKSTNSMAYFEVPNTIKNPQNTVSFKETFRPVFIKMV